MALVSKNFSDIITFSRASAATRVNASGLVESVATNAPRFDYDPITLAARGILIEEQRTNLVRYSSNLDNSTWTKVGASISPNTSASPDGAFNANTVFASAGAGYHYTFKDETAIAGATYTVSGFVKAGTTRYINFGDSGDGPWHTAVLDTQTGAITAQTNCTATAQSVGNGWFRVTCTLTRTNANTIQSYVGPDTVSTSTNGPSFTAAGTETCLAWGFQVEQASFATSYIPSTTTFTGRSSTGTFIGANGLIQTAASGVARLQYNPANLSVAPFLLLEESRTNLWLHSENATNWGNPFNISASTNAAIAPDGATTADKLVENGSNVPHRFEYNFTATASTTYTLSFFAKQAERSQLVLFAFTDNFVFSSQGATFDLAAGTVLSATSGTVAHIQNVGNGWYRCSWRITSNAFGTTATAYFGVGPGVGGSSAYQGDGTSGVLVWGAQLEAGSFATSYIPTTTAQVTRAADTSTSSQTTRSADVASVNTLSPWYNATEGTLYAEAVRGAYGSTDRNVATFSDGTASNVVEIYGDALSAIGRLLVTTSGAIEANVIGVGFQPAVTTKVASAFGQNDFRAALGGTLLSADTAGAVPLVSQFQIGSRVGSSFFFGGHIRSIKYFPRRLSNAELQALTA